MKRRLLLTILSVLLIQCSTAKEFEQRLEDNNCEEALEKMPENQGGFRLVSKTQQVSGTVMSYAAIGGAYTVQVLWDTTATVGTVLILCSPSIALAVLTSSSGASASASSLFCFPGDFEKIQAPYLGRNMIEATRDWNCPNVDAISRSIRRVSQCYASRGGSANKQKAFHALKSVEGSGSFYRCLSNKERNAFLKDLEKFNADG